MPTLMRFGTLQLRMYADDHRSPHFHLVGPRVHVRVRISDLAVIAGRARPAEIAEALAWAREQTTLLASTWANLNERD